MPFLFLGVCLVALATIYFWPKPKTYKSQLLSDDERLDLPMKHVSNEEFRRSNRFLLPREDQ